MGSFDNGTSQASSATTTTTPTWGGTTTTDHKARNTTTASRAGGHYRAKEQPQSAWQPVCTDVAKSASVKDEEVDAREKFGFKVNDAVRWSGADSDWPRGMTGIVAGFSEDRVKVQLPKGVWRFKPTELTKASAATSAARPPVQTVTTTSAEAPFAGEVWEPWVAAEDLMAMRRCVEWYFSDSNLSTDQALHHRISQQLPEGWLCCSEMLRFDDITDLGATPELLLKCLRKSHLETKVTLTADELVKAQGTLGEFGKRGVFIRRRQPLPPLLSRDRLHLMGEAIATDPSQLVLADRHQTMNRLRDLWKVQRQLKLSEVGDDVTVFKERILPNVSPENRPPSDKPVVLAVGYERIVYGDHGAYIEFSSSQIRWKAWPNYFDKQKYNSYFNEYYTKASHSLWEARWQLWDPNASRGLLMLYAQSKSVCDRPWAPGCQTDPHAGRPTGYADYRPGYFYAAADEFLVSVENHDCKSVIPGLESSTSRRR